VPISSSSHSHHADLRKGVAALTLILAAALIRRTLDMLGSITEITGKEGNPLRSYRYDAWGGITAGETAHDVNPFRYVGAYGVRWQDSTLGMYHCRARWYGPQVGRFTQRDPLWGFLLDDLYLNRYIYVADSPVNYIDPSGYAGFTPTPGPLNPQPPKPPANIMTPPPPKPPNNNEGPAIPLDLGPVQECKLICRASVIVMQKSVGPNFICVLKKVSVWYSSPEHYKCKCDIDCVPCTHLNN
jgi:RHS repeat-associated protein